MREVRDWYLVLGIVQRYSWTRPFSVFESPFLLRRKLAPFCDTCSMCYLYALEFMMSTTAHGISVHPRVTLP